MNDHLVLEDNKKFDYLFKIFYHKAQIGTKMFTLLAQFCFLLTGSSLPEGVFDDYFFYHLQVKKDSRKRKVHEKLEIQSRMTPYQMKIEGFPSDTSESEILKILHSKAFGGYFFKYGRPSFIHWTPIKMRSMITNYWVTVIRPTLYFDTEKALRNTNRKFENEVINFEKYGTNEKIQIFSTKLFNFLFKKRIKL